jgi:hypothetical protein
MGEEGKGCGRGFAESAVLEESLSKARPVIRQIFDLGHRRSFATSIEGTDAP